jgi:hypothetical protein
MQVSTLRGVSGMAPPSAFQPAADAQAPYFPAGDAVTDALARYPRVPLSAIRAPYEFDDDYEAPPGATSENSQASSGSGVSVTEAAGWLVDLSSGGVYGLAMALIGRLARSAAQPAKAEPAKAEPGNTDARPATSRPTRQAPDAIADATADPYGGRNGDASRPAWLRQDTPRLPPSHDMYRA